jgi:hypothetical protein
MIKKIPLILSNPPKFLICYRGSSSVKHMLNSKKNKHAEKNSTTSKVGQFLPIENGYQSFANENQLKKVKIS